MKKLYCLSLILILLCISKISFAKEIQQIHNSVVIKTWSSVKEAGRVGNYNTSLIREVCIGKRKSHAGYEWKYVNTSDKEANMGVKKPISC